MYMACIELRFRPSRRDSDGIEDWGLKVPVTPTNFITERSIHKTTITGMVIAHFTPSPELHSAFICFILFLFSFLESLSPLRGWRVIVF